MTNIWQFIIQSLSVSLVAVFLIALKTIFKDKLSARWQYGIWIILALRILTPVRCDKLVLLPVGIYMEVLKSFVETKLNSAFSNPYLPTQPAHILPHVTQAPRSITDALFIIYCVGVIAFLCFYLFSYIRLRLAIKKGVEVTGEDAQRIKDIFINNKVRFVKVVYVDGISSAFICGVFRPVMVLPISRQTDEKVILHELMHLKHMDSAQSIFWCILRCLHWCNPFMHFVFNVIGNDMESLCDQRVLERLEGEERREYGVLLLNEVNRKYARMPGTTSVSNGGRNISNRIEAIVRFKKFPKGMSLVSICIIIVAAMPCFFVNAGGGYNADYFNPASSFEFEKSVACSRTYRCTTVAGAIDTYAKSLIYENGIMLLTASPTANHKQILENLQKSAFYENGFDELRTAEIAPFSVFSLAKTGENKYSAILVFSTTESDTDAENNSDEYKVYADSLIIPIEIFKENNWWVVTEAGERIVSKNYLDESLFNQVHTLGDDLPPLFYSTLEGKKGTLTTKQTVTYNIDYEQITSDSTSFFTDGIGFDESVHRNAAFSGCLAETVFIYTYNGDDYKDVRHVRAEYTEDIDFVFEQNKAIANSGGFSASSTDGSGSMADAVNNNGEWDKKIMFTCFHSNLDPLAVMESHSGKYKCAIYIDGELTDEFIVEVGANG